MEPNIENTNCRNCGVEMPLQSLYCPKCSQKNTDGRVPVFTFIKDLLENIFNLDSKLFKTSLGLFIPGKLTNQFFQGKHKSYATPSRMFLVSAILFFALVSWMAKNELQDENMDGDFAKLEKRLEKKKERLAMIKGLRENALKEENEAMLIALDSMEAKTRRTKYGTNEMNVQLIGKKYNFKRIDIITLSADSMIQKYKIEGMLDQMFFKQGFKTFKDPKSLVTFILGNLTWMMILFVPVMALIFKLLYIRKKKFFVEHLVFLFHVHSFGLILGAIILTITEYFDFGGGSNAFSILILGMIIYLTIALKKVYQQSWGKTIFKLALIGVSYILVLALCIFIILAISFLLF